MANGLEKKTVSSVPLSNFILSGITLTDTSRPARANQILLSCQFCEVYGSIQVRPEYISREKLNKVLYGDALPIGPTPYPFIIHF